MTPGESVREALPRLIDRGLRRFLDELERALRSGDFRELHEARIAGKRLRYEIEFFEAVLGEEGRAAYALMSKLQDRLGFIADATSFDAYYEALLDDLGERDPRRPGLIARSSEVRRERIDALAALREFVDPGGEAQTAGAALAAMLAAALRSLADSSNVSSGSGASETVTGS
jgi:CHAD domain-containing protein